MPRTKKSLVQKLQKEEVDRTKNLMSYPPKENIWAIKKKVQEENMRKQKLEDEKKKKYEQEQKRIHAQKLREEKQKWLETVGRPVSRQSVVFGNRKWPDEKTMVGDIVSRRSSPRTWSIDGKNDVWNAQKYDFIVRVASKDFDEGFLFDWNVYRELKGSVYIKMLHGDLGVNIHLDTYVWHLTEHGPLDTSLCIKTYALACDKNIPFKTRCRGGKRCQNRKIGHLVNFEHC